MVTGRKAFEGSSKTTLIAAIVDRDPPPVSQIQPLTPPALEHVIRKCVAKQADDRWQSAYDIAEELRWISEAGSQPGLAVGLARRPRREAWAWMIAGLAIFAAILIAIRSSRRVEPSRIYSASIVPPAGISFFFEGPNSGVLTISPDGKYITFAAFSPDGIRRLWVRNVASGESRVLQGTDTATYPFWSPDGKHIGFFANRKLKIISVDDGSSVHVCDVMEPRGGSWSRDGWIIFEPHWRDPIHKVPASGGTPGGNHQTRRPPKRDHSSLSALSARRQTLSLSSRQSQLGDHQREQRDLSCLDRWRRAAPASSRAIQRGVCGRSSALSARSSTGPLP